MAFQPLPMKRLTLHLIREDAETAAAILAQAGVFNPEGPEHPEAALAEFPAERYREVYDGAAIRLAKIRQWIPCEPGPVPERPEPVPLAALEEADHFLHALWRPLSRHEEKLRTLTEQQRYLDQLGASLERFAGLDIDLAMLQGETSFIKLHVGIVPPENLRQLERALSLSGHLLEGFHSTAEGVSVIIAGPAEAEDELSGLLRSSDFRPLQLPPEFRDRPDRIRARIEADRQQVAQEQAAVEADIRTLAEAQGEGLAAVCRQLRLARSFAALAADLRGQGSLVSLEGWAPAAEIAGIERRLDERLAHPYLLSARDPEPAEYPAVPSLVRHPRVLQPFLTLVSNYGMPRYGEIDPTILFAVTFIAMFGMMFGDVGHGAVIAGSALFVRKRFPKVVPFLVAAGASSILFGFLYGSIFGYEHVLHAVWIAPLSDPLYMLQVALWWGVGFIVLGTLLSIRNLLVGGHTGDALFDRRGVAGLALFAGGLYAGWQFVGAGRFGLAETAAVLGPVAVIVAWKWRELDNPVGERVVIVFIEGFESITNYLANTLSFLRVAAFALNHVALAVAVFTLAESMETFGHWTTVVLGNVFIIVLEGAIVTIQCLRLEYYEGFSRFYSGDGRAFRPLSF